MWLFYQTLAPAPELYKSLKPIYEGLVKDETIPIEQRQRCVKELGKAIVKEMADAEKKLAAVTARCERDIAEAQAALYYSKLAHADLLALGDLK